MLLRKSLLVCLPVLALTACGTSKQDDKKSAANSPTVYGNNETTPPTTIPENPDTVIVTPPITPPTESKGGEPTGDQNQNQNGPTTPAHECETLVIDFERGSNGAEVKQEYNDAQFGVTFLAHRTSKNGSTVSNVQPIYTTMPQTGLGATPEVSAEANGGYVKLFFAKPTSIISLDLINVENNTSNIELFNAGDNGSYVSKSLQAIPQKGHNETFGLSVDDHSYVRKMAIKLSGPSAVDNIKICVKN